MRNNILGTCLIITIIILFFYGLAIRSLGLRVQTLEDSIAENNLWGRLDQIHDATLEALKKVNRLSNSGEIHNQFEILNQK